MSNIVIIILGIGIIQSTIFALLVVLKKQKKNSDWILLCWFLSFSVHFILILSLGFKNPFSILLIFAKTFGLIYGPLLFLYTYSVFTNKFSIRELIHFSPFVLVTFISFLIAPSSPPIWEVILLVIKIISLLSYPFFTIYWLNRRIDYLKNKRADNFILESSWIKTLSILLLINVVMGIIHVLVNILFEVQFSDFLDIFSYVAIITIMGFYGLKFGIVYEHELAISTAYDKKSYRHSPLKQLNKLYI